MAEEQTFVIPLNAESSDAQFRFPILNRPGEINRPYVIDRGKTHIVQADLVDVLHGRLEEDGEAGTLVVADFRFIPARAARRFKWASVSFVFSGDGSQIGPDVIDIAPKGHFSLHRTSRKVERGQGFQASVQVPLGPVSPGLAYNVDLKEKYDDVDQATLSGTMRREKREIGGRNVARWVLDENSTAKSGIPTEMRVAILLQRLEEEEEKQFQAMVEIKVEVDLKTAFMHLPKRLVGGIPKDDPVVFDPAKSSKGAEKRYTGERLAGQDLKVLSHVLTTTWLDKVGHEGDEPDEGDGEATGDGGTRDSETVSRD